MDCIICGRQLPFDGSPCLCKQEEQNDWLRTRIKQRDLADEGEWDSGDYLNLKNQIEREEKMRHEGE